MTKVNPKGQLKESINLELTTFFYIIFYIIVVIIFTVILGVANIDMYRFPAFKPIFLLLNLINRDNSVYFGQAIIIQFVFYPILLIALLNLLSFIICKNDISSIYYKFISKKNSFK